MDFKEISGAHNNSLEQLLEQKERIPAEVGSQIALQSVELRLPNSPGAVNMAFQMLAVLNRLISENGSGVATVALIGAENIFKQLLKINREHNLQINLREQINFTLAAAENNPRVPEASPLSHNHSYLELVMLKGAL